MTSITPETAAEIHTAFDIDIAYTGAGLTAGAITAVKGDDPANEFLGAGETLRKISFEIRDSALAGTPIEGDTLDELDEVGVPIAGLSWRVIEATERADVGAWSLIVESA